MWAITLTSQVRCHSSSDASGPPGGPGTPALEQNRSMGPPNSLACRTSSTISCSRLTSVLTARPPSSPATASAEGRSMSATTIARGDSAATLLASARPIPLPAPVITTFRSASSMGADRLVFSVGEMEFELTGLLRFAGGLLSRQYAEGVRDNMKRLKAYIESGKGPKAK